MIRIAALVFIVNSICNGASTWNEGLQKDLASLEAQKIGMQIWMNEASQRKDLLVFWSQSESFPSLGIGHCIWFPEGLDAPYTQEFPLLCDYLEEHNVQLPLWLKRACHVGAPWKSREDFLQDNVRTEELRILLYSTIELQTQFMIERLERQFSLMVKAANSEQKEKLIHNFNAMSESILGRYALIDYLNFKGSGLNPREVSKLHHWGLMQVLLDMPSDTIVENAPQAFAISAAKILIILIQNSAPKYNRIKFLRGWINRIITYTDPNIFNVRPE